jgi:hypothetical protein
LSELAEALGERLATERSESILLSSLPTLSGDSLLCDPAFVRKAAQQRINEIVVQRGVAKNEAGLALQLVSMLWPLEQGGQNY